MEPEIILQDVGFNVWFQIDVQYPQCPAQGDLLWLLGLLGGIWFLGSDCHATMVCNRLQWMQDGKGRKECQKGLSNKLNTNPDLWVSLEELGSWGPAVMVQ